MKIYNIPGSTPLDSETIRGLIPNLTTQSELNEFEANNIAQALLWTKSSGKIKKNLLTVSGLIELHKQMFGQVWEWAGKFRWSQTNIGVPKENIQNELGQLLGNVQYWLENETYSLDELAIRFHHKLVWIHPFPNGNGRWSRLATDLLLEFNGGNKFSWGSDDLSHENDDRSRYIKALRVADEHKDFNDLLRFARGIE
tara:strand:- start:6919 stop:7512 length:594 start_codon:yes stop_codon:yes gene_type:complete